MASVADLLKFIELGRAAQTAVDRATSTPAPNVHLTAAQARRCVRLLGEYQTNLEELIESVLLPGETQPREAGMRALNARDRKRWREAEDLVKVLSEVRHAARR